MQGLIVRVKRGEVMLKSKMLKGADVEFFSNEGKKVLERQDLPSDTFRLKNLKEGVYIYIIHKSGESLTGKVLVT